METQIAPNAGSLRLPLTRRAFGVGFGLAAGAGLIGAGLDHLAAQSAARRSAEAAARHEAEALHRKADADAQAQAAALQQAAEDKAAAMDQIKAQLPSAGDRALSSNFERLARARPWLTPLRFSVGYFECEIAGVTYRGAAELLDRFGTLVLCGHEFVAVPKRNAALHVTFFPPDRRPLRLAIQMGFVDRDNDIGFATIQPGDLPVIGEAGVLRPVRWGKEANQPPTTGEEVVFVGFPEGIARLHATLGTVRGPRLVDTMNGDGSIASHDCKIETGGVTFSGMSGGGAFRDGAFIGVVNFSSPAGSDPFTYFTPAQAIREAYAQLYPARARAAHVLPMSRAATAGWKTDCAINRRDFFPAVAR